MHTAAVGRPGEHNRVEVYGDGDCDGDGDDVLVGDADVQPSASLAQSGGGDVVGVIVAVGDDPGAHVCPTDGLDDGDGDGMAVGGDGCAVFVFGLVS